MAEYRDKVKKLESELKHLQSSAVEAGGGSMSTMMCCACAAIPVIIAAVLYYMQFSFVSSINVETGETSVSYGKLIMWTLILSGLVIGSVYGYSVYA